MNDVYEKRVGIQRQPTLKSMSSTPPPPFSEKDQATIQSTNTPTSTHENPMNDSKPNFEVDEEAVAGESPNPASDAVKIPWSYKIFALVCIVAFPIGTNWTSASLGPLKSTLRKDLGITNTQFGVISSADAVVNSIWPIVGGLCLDWFGPSVITLCCTSVILVGSVLAALGITLGTWRLLVAGHVIMGFGIAVVDSAQQKFFYHWFGADGLAFAFGFENAIAGTVSLVAGMVAIPIKESTGWYGWCFWIPVFFCAFSVIVSVAYILFERFFVPTQMRFKSARTLQPEGPNKKKLTWATLFLLPWTLWMLPATQLLQSGAAGGFSTGSADIIGFRGYTQAVAGYLSSAQKILPIVLSPVIGAAVDKYGHRFHLVAL